MFNNTIPTDNNSCNRLPQMPTHTMWQIMDGMDGKKKKHHSKGKKGHKKNKNVAKDKNASCLQDKLYSLCFCLGAMQEKNKTMENMMRLALAGQKGTLRTDVLDVGFEILDDGKA